MCTFPLLNVIAACGCKSLWDGRQKSLPRLISSAATVSHVVANVIVAITLLAIARQTYSGGSAIQSLHNAISSKDNLIIFIDDLATKTGVTRFTEINDHWKYTTNAATNIKTSEISQYTHVIVEGRSKYSKSLKPFIKTHEILETVDGFSQVHVDYQYFPPLRIKTRPSIFVLQRKYFSSGVEKQAIQSYDEQIFTDRYEMDDDDLSPKEQLLSTVSDEKNVGSANDDEFPQNLAKTTKRDTDVLIFRAPKQIRRSFYPNRELLIHGRRLQKLEIKTYNQALIKSVVRAQKRHHMVGSTQIISMLPTKEKNLIRLALAENGNAVEIAVHNDYLPTNNDKSKDLTVLNKDLNEEYNGSKHTLKQTESVGLKSNKPKTSLRRYVKIRQAFDGLEDSLPTEEVLSKLRSDEQYLIVTQQLSKLESNSKIPKLTKNPRLIKDGRSSVHAPFNLKELSHSNSDILEHQSSTEIRFDNVELNVELFDPETVAIRENLMREDLTKPLLEDNRRTSIVAKTSSLPEPNYKSPQASNKKAVEIINENHSEYPPLAKEPLKGTNNPLLGKNVLVKTSNTLDSDRNTVVALWQTEVKEQVSKESIVPSVSDKVEKFHLESKGSNGESILPSLTTHSQDRSARLSTLYSPNVLVSPNVDRHMTGGYSRMVWWNIMETKLINLKHELKMDDKQLREKLQNQGNFEATSQSAVVASANHIELSKVKISLLDGSTENYTDDGAESLPQHVSQPYENHLADGEL